MRWIAMATAALIAGQVLAGQIAPRAGWEVHETPHAFADLVERLNKTVRANGLIVVTRAGPTKAAASRGITIPGNMVVGVYNNDFAVRALGFSTAAMIEAPIRFYVTEEDDGTATLSYKTPTLVFSPYFDEGGEGLRALAAELDAKFAAIATAAAE
ncbi:DUF302 domain-containing protein [Rhodobacteraceae bacterium NNCM2]|nr:DUF302 domain-containing protein [Coraliihabitans acroporae]